MAEDYLEQNFGIDLRCCMETTHSVKASKTRGRCSWSEQFLHVFFRSQADVRKFSPYLRYSGQVKGIGSMQIMPLWFPPVHRVMAICFDFIRVVFWFYFSAGLGDMAVSNTVGSNVFDILVGLGVPWGLQTMAIDYGSTVCILDKSLICTFILFFKKS